MGVCAFCEPKKYFKEGNIDRVLYTCEKCYVAVPREPAMRGHLLIVSNKKENGGHIEDITEVRSDEEYETLCEMIRVAAAVSRELKNWDPSIRKVYVLCEGETPHLHFHLKPRREGDEKGDLFLFEKELQESRWVVDPENRESSRMIAIEKGIEKVEKGMFFAKKHEKLIEIGKWIKPYSSALIFYEEMVNELKPVVTRAIENDRKRRGIFESRI